MNQRRADKVNVSGYLDQGLKAAIKKSGMNEAAFVEWAVVVGLVQRGLLTDEVIMTLTNEGRLRPTTTLLRALDKPKR